jgi:hypothetical protein
LVPESRSLILIPDVMEAHRFGLPRHQREAAWLAVCLLAVPAGYAVVRAPRALLSGLALALSSVCPRWLLLAAAILAASTAVDYPIVGRLQLSDLLLILFVARSSTRWLAGHKRRALASSAGWMIAFLAWAWFSLIVTQSWGTAWALARITLYGAVFIVALADDSLAPNLYRFVLVLACLEAGLGLWELTPHVGSRIYGWYGDPGVAGLFFLTGLATARLVRPSLRVLAYPLLIAAVARTYTRSIWVAGLISLFVLAWPRPRHRLLRLGVFAIGALALAWFLIPLVTEALHLNPASIVLRIQSWRYGMNLIWTEPLVGHGWAVGATAGVLRMPPPFNVWINVGASTGLPGVVLLGGLLSSVLRTLSQSRSDVGAAAFQYTVAFLVVSLGEMTLWATSPATIEFFVLTAVALGMPDLTQPTTPKGEPLPGLRAKGSAAQ